MGLRSPALDLLLREEEGGWRRSGGEMGERRGGGGWERRGEGEGEGRWIYTYLARVYDNGTAFKSPSRRPEVFGCVPLDIRGNNSNSMQELRQVI